MEPKPEDLDPRAVAIVEAAIEGIEDPNARAGYLIQIAGVALLKVAQIVSEHPELGTKPEKARR